MPNEAARAQRTPETVPPDGPPRGPVEPITREDPNAVPDPKPIDDPRPPKPCKTALGPLEREIERLFERMEQRPR